MPLPAKSLRIVVNPYKFVDEHGAPQAAVPADRSGPTAYRDRPDHPDPAERYEQRQFIGAQRKAERLRPDVVRMIGRHRSVQVGAHRTTFEHSSDVVTVPASDYYRRAIRDQDLFAADLESWVEAGGHPAHFQDPDEKLAQAKHGAIAHFVAMHGEEDPRLATLAAHWDDRVEQRHPVGKALTGAPTLSAKAKE